MYRQNDKSPGGTFPWGKVPPAGGGRGAECTGIWEAFPYGEGGTAKGRDG